MECSVFPILASFCTFALAVLLYFAVWEEKRSTRVAKKTQGKPLGPTECRIKDIKTFAFLRYFYIKMAIRLTNLSFLRHSSVPDPPTLFPQVMPSEEQQQHNAPDFESLLKKPSNIKGYQFVSISELVEAYRNARTTPLQVTQNALEAILRSEKPDVNLRSFIEWKKSDALLMAQESTKRYAENRPLSVIDGVPVGIKDEFAVAGYHRRCGTAFIGEEAEEEDCKLVRKLRDLGAIILGITNMHELGFGTTGINPNRYHGTSRNPYNLEYYSGGSSGGSAAAVAAGLCPIAIGKDGGGSIRVPSILCGVVGIKPTFGRVTVQATRYGGYTISHAGPICNNVRDTAIVYALLSGRDPEYYPGLIQPEHATLEGFENLDLSDLTVGVDWSFAACAEEEVVEQFKKAVEYIRSEGANVVSIQIPELEETRIAHALTIGTELSFAIENEYPGEAYKLNPETFIFTNSYEDITSYDYYLCQKQRTRAIEFMKTLFGKVDCILTPASACTAKKIPLGSSKYGLSDITTTIKHVRFAFLGNLTGIPGVVVPIGYNKANLPIGIQVMTSWWNEHVAFRVAHTFEGMVPRRQPQVRFNILDPDEA